MEDLTRRGMLAATAAAVWCWPAADRSALPGAAAAFRLPPKPEPDPTPSFKTGFIDHDPPLAYVHCPSIAALPDGRLACCWYAGSREGGRDVGVWMAGSDPAGRSGDAIAWGPPRLLVDRDSATRELGRFIDKVGNPVLFNDAGGRLWLVYVSIAVGGWSGSSLNAKCSADGGATWSRSHRLTLSPFFNISELVRAAPVLLESGEIGLPVYHECIGKFPEMLWLRPEGDRLAMAKSRMAGGRSLLQPAVVPLAPRRAVAYLRNHSRRHRLVSQQTDDGGATWSIPVETPVPNPDASIAATRLSGGEVLVAFNNSDRGRDNLCLAISPDGLRDWRLIATLDDEPDQKFAYPFLSVDSTGLVHLVYSWKMRRIRHVAVNEAWLLAQRPGRPLVEPQPPEPRA
jgi:predicted neuraminidase